MTKSSGKSAWWQCFKGHEWEARINSRVKGRGCPFCAGKKAYSGDNLAILYPEVAKEWHNVKNDLNSPPSTFRSKSNKKVWWICSLHTEHEWEATINSRTTGNGCPYCAGKKTSSFYSLAVVNPILSREWHPKKTSLYYLQMSLQIQEKKFGGNVLKDMNGRLLLTTEQRAEGAHFVEAAKNQKYNLMSAL